MTNHCTGKAGIRVLGKAKVSKLRWDGEIFDIEKKPTFEEMSMIERQAGCGFGDLTSIEQGAATMLITLRRRGILLGWQDMLKMSPADLIVEVDAPEPEQEEAPDPTVAAAAVPQP